MTPEQEDQVRRALAAAVSDEDPSGTVGNPGPMPPEVAARLDSVLGELSAERSPAASVRSLSPALKDDAVQDSTVQDGAVRGGADPDWTAAGADRPEAADELARRRRDRRRRVPLAAAAACLATLVGATVATGGFGLTGGSSESTSNDTAAGSKAVPRQEAASPGGGAARSPSASAPLTDSEKRAFVRSAGRLRTVTLPRDVRRLLDGRTSALPAQGRASGAACDRPARRAGDRLVDVRLDGRPAVLLVHAPVAGRRAVEVFGCRASATPLASVTVPATGR